MSDTVIRLAILLAIFASVFVILQIALNSAWTRRSHLNTVNKRLKMISEGRSREEVVAVLRKNDGTDFSSFPPLIAGRLEKLEKSLRATGIGMTTGQAVFAMVIGFAVIFAIAATGAVLSGFIMSPGVLLMIAALAFCAAIFLPSLVISGIAQKRRKRIEEQFPISLDVFVRALRAGHPVASAIDLLTKELPDPIGSEYGLIADEVSYGADLTDSLASMAERWELEDIRMFVVSLSVQTETGGNLAEILEKLAEVIRARASLYRKVRALSSEGRMTGWMLTVLPVGAFVGLFLINPGFYLDVAQDPVFIIGFVALLGLYLIGFFMIRAMVDIKV